MSRLLQPPRRIEVRLDRRGRPTGLSHRGRFFEVRRVCRRWRVEEDWWRSPVARDYFEVETSGFVGVIFRDLAAGGWFLERVYD